MLGPASSLFMFLCTVRKLENGLWQKLSSMTKYPVAKHTSRVPSWVPDYRELEEHFEESCRHAMQSSGGHTRTADAKINPNKFSIWKVLNVSTQIWLRPKTVRKCRKSLLCGAKFEEEEYYPPKLCSYCIQITMSAAGKLFVRGEKWFKHQNKWDYFRILM